MCWNGRLIRNVLFVFDTAMSKVTPWTRLLFLLISFAICPFFQRRR